MIVEQMGGDDERKGNRVSLNYVFAIREMLACLGESPLQAKFQ